MMMEVLGHDSDLDYPLTGAIAPTDLYRFDLTTGQRSFNTASTTLSYFSIDGGKTNLVRFNQNSTGDYGDWLSPDPMIQNAFGTRGATPNLGLELLELDVLGYTRITNFTPVLTAAPTQNYSPGVATSFSLGSFADPDTGPWKVTVSWGDGSADTSFFVVSAGSLGSKVHTYAAGSYLPKITVTDFTNLSGSSSFNVTGYTTSVSLDGTKDLIVKDVAVGGKNDNLTIKADSANSRYILSDPSALSILAVTGTVPGATVSADKHTVYVPFASVAGTFISVNAGAGTDKLTIDTSLGNIAKQIKFDGGAGVNTLTAPNQTNTWNITGAGAGTIAGRTAISFTNVQNLIGGTGSDTFNFSNSFGVSGSVDGKGGANTLNYALYSASRPVTVNLANRSATNINGGVPNGIANITGLIGGAGRDTLIGANGTRTWNITANNAGTISTTFSFFSIENLTGGTGTDIFNFGLGFSITGNLDGGAGANTLVGPNADKTWSISAPNKGLLPGVVASFQNVQNLTGGSGKDIFIFANRATMGGRIDGGAGHNWLNYSAFTTSLTINLKTGVDSAAVGGAFHFDNILGSAAGGDSITGGNAGGILVAHNSSNTVTAGAGRSLVIGGSGTNTIVGGAADDILINGSTSYDGNIAILQSILTTWQSSQTYAQRLASLQAAGPNLLKVGTTVFLTPGPTSGTLRGNAGQDWFFTATLNSIQDLAANETATLG